MCSYCADFVLHNMSIIRSGDDMKNILFITRKYWHKHKKNLLALLFAGTVMMAVVSASFLQIKSEFNRTLHNEYDSDGMYDVMLVDASDEFVSSLTAKKQPSKSEIINVYGNADIYGSMYAIGSIQNDAELAHIPFESGVMPKKDNEVAVSRGVLANVGFNGSIGDTIKIGEKSYTISGIIDSKYDQRSGSQTSLDAMGGEVSSKPIPLIFIADTSSYDVKYKITMFDGVVEGKEDNETVFGMTVSDFLDLTTAEFGEDARWSVGINNKEYMAYTLAQNSKEFKENVRWLILLSVIAATIAVLSVFSVLRIIFAERAHTDELLHRVGMSNRKIKAMYALECILLTVFQGLIGSALGIVGYELIHDYRIKQLGYADISAFTSNRLVTDNTYDPFIMGLAFTAVIMALGYITASLFRGKSIRLLALGHGIGKALSNGSITAIQIVSLTLIMTGSMLGYMYYTSDGKEYMNQLNYEPAPGYELGESLDMEKDNIEEYYACGAPMVLTPYAVIDDMEYHGIPMTQPDYSFGIDDESLSKLGNVRACAEMTGTFLVYDKQNEMLDEQITTDKKEINDDLIASSETECKNFFDKGQIGSKYLYRINTRLVNESVLNALEQYVESGEINTDAIIRGEEIIAVSDSSSSVFNAGEKITIGSLTHNDENGINEESSSEVTIGAVVVIRFDDFKVDNLLRYAVTSEYGTCLLTTQTGAKNLGLFGAAYTEVFSDHHIDGGLIPPSAGMTLTSLEKIKNERKIEKATSMGGAVLIIVLMSVLGFAAYFNGIGLKIKLKEYQIAILRSIGTSKAKIRARMFLSNLKIPVIAAAISGAVACAIQKFFASQYDKMVALAQPDGLGVISFDDATIIKQQEMIDKYFLNSEMWMPSISKPLMIVFLAVVIITLLLTVISLRSLKTSISDMMAKGRKRQ